MNRTTFLMSSASLVAAGAATAKAADVPGGTHLVERLSDFDQQAFAALVGRPAQIRQLVESVAFKIQALNNIKNTFNGLQFGYGYPAAQIAVAIANHGPASAYGYSDYLWSKYRIGELFTIVDANNATITSNVFFPATSPFDTNADPDDPKGFYQDTSIQTLQRRGAIVLACHTAIEEQARTIIKKGFAPAGMTASDVADDILTHLVPGAVVVPSMVATIAVLQATYHYTYLTLTL